MCVSPPTYKLTHDNLPGTEGERPGEIYSVRQHANTKKGRLTFETSVFYIGFVAFLDPLLLFFKSM